MKRLTRLSSCVLLLSWSAQAMFVMPELVPADRLVKNAQTYLAQHPSDPLAHYTLGRIHYLAFVLKLEKVPAHPAGPDGLPRPARDQLIGEPLAALRRQRAEELASEEVGTAKRATPEYLRAVSKHLQQLEKDAWRPAEVSREVLVSHAAAAAEAFQRAMALDPKNALYPLSLGSLFEQFAEWKEDAKLEKLPPIFARDPRASARDHYFNAWSLAVDDDAKAKSLPLLGLSALVSFESGRAFLRLAEELKSALPEAQKAAIPRVKAALAKLEKLSPGAITPLVLARRPVAHFRELLAPEKGVEFDLRGFGAPAKWEWLTPDAGLLVWDPNDQRNITSGRQLFGSYTFSIFWRNGYEALRALDDNADGQLSGVELEGISVWFDRNGDGRSTSDEVIPAAGLGVCALCITATGLDEGHPMNATGVTFQDGRVLPTWDWIAEPVAP